VCSSDLVEKPGHHIQAFLTRDDSDARLFACSGPQTLAAHERWCNLLNSHVSKATPSSLFNLRCT